MRSIAAAAGSAAGREAALQILAPRLEALERIVTDTGRVLGEKIDGIVSRMADGSRVSAVEAVRLDARITAAEREIGDLKILHANFDEFGKTLDQNTRDTRELLQHQGEERKRAQEAEKLATEDRKRMMEKRGDRWWDLKIHFLPYAVAVLFFLLFGLIGWMLKNQAVTQTTIENLRPLVMMGVH